jgi:hypothetical protein
MDLTFRKIPPSGALQLAQKLSKENLKGQVERTSPQASSESLFQRPLWQTIFGPEVVLRLEKSVPAPSYTYKGVFPRPHKTERKLGGWLRIEG